jgi:nicotinamidase-related amidase
MTEKDSILSDNSGRSVWRSSALALVPRQRRMRVVVCVGVVTVAAGVATSCFSELAGMTAGV